jgi:hypothetical protein
MVAPGGVVRAGAPAGLPQGDPGQPTYESVQGAAPLVTDRTIANWHGQFTDPTNGVTYGYNMVGGDPALNHDTTIPVDLIPIDVTFSKQGGFALKGSDVVARVLASPLFNGADFSTTPTVTSAADADGNVQVIPGGELSAGNTDSQYLDALMRSQFNKVGTGYHVRLGHPTVMSPWTMDCSKAGGAAFVNARGVAYGMCNNFPFDAPWGQWRLDPTHLVIFVSRNIVVGSARGCCFLGFHTAGRVEGRGSGVISGQGAQPVQTWMITTYIDPGLYRPATSPMESTIEVLGHEIAEWADDPFATNVVNHWYSPLPPQDGCSDLMETGDAVDTIKYSLPGNTFDTGPYADGRWHLQDINFLPFFSRESPNLTSQATQSPSARIGRYSFMGDLNPYDVFHGPAPAC